MANMIDYSGQRHGHMVLLRYSRSGGAGVGAKWMARCDCGTVKEVLARDLTSGRIKTCGNCEYSRRLRSGNISIGQLIGKAERALYGYYVLEADSQKTDWQVTVDEFRKLYQNPCSICGDLPKIPFNRTKLKYNKLVRVETSKPYTLANTATLCHRCHRKKGQDNLPDFLDYLAKVYQNLTSK